jgi:hypothetical protein
MVPPSKRFCGGSFFSSHDVICTAIALLEIEPKKLPIKKTLQSRSEKGDDMTTNSRVPASKVLVTALLMSLLLIVTSQAQTDLPAYTGRFTLAQAIQWNTSVLQPGDYTITIGSTGTPIMALIRTISGRPVARVRSWTRSESANGKNALLLKERNGRLQVYSLALADLGMVLIYDPALAREAVLESQVSQTVPLWAKR